MYGRRLDATEDSEPVDQPREEHAYGEIGVAVDRPEEELRNRVERSTAWSKV